MRFFWRKSPTIRIEFSDDGFELYSDAAKRAGVPLEEFVDRAMAVYEAVTKLTGEDGITRFPNANIEFEFNKKPPLRLLK